MEPFKPLWVHFPFPAKDLRALASDPNSPVLSRDVHFGDKGEVEVNLEIPTFQRGLRWGPKKRRQFLASLKQGRPVGTLVLARKEMTRKTKSRPASQTWYVIDGQQRIHAINTILSNFWSDGCYDLSSLSKELKHLAETISGVDQIAVEDAINDLARDNDKFESKYLLETKDFVDQLISTLGIALEESRREKVENIARKIREKLNEQLQQVKDLELSSHLVMLPENAYSDVERRRAITEIFRDVNSGVKLDKNDLLAAEWDQYKVSWPPDGLPKSWKKYLTDGMFKEMRDRVSDSYSDEEDFEPEIEKLSYDDVSFYDFIYSLRWVTLWNPTKLDSKRLVFSGKSKRDAIDSDLALDTLSLFLTGHVKDSEQLGVKHLAAGTTTFDRGPEDQLEVAACLKAYNDAAEAVENALSPFSRFNVKTPNPRTVGKTAATHYLANYLALSYLSNFSLRKGQLKVNGDGVSVTSLKKLWKKTLPAWWLYDIMSDELVGSSAHGEAQSLTWDEPPSKDHPAGLPNMRICDDPKVESFRDIFEKVFVSGATKSTILPKRGRTPKSAIALMCLIYSDTNLGNDDLDMDHLVPFKKQSDGRFPTNLGQLRLNHPANWMPFAPIPNRVRGNTAWADHISQIKPAQKRRLIEQRLLLPASEFKRESRNSNEAFLTLMTRRWAIIFKKAMDTLDQVKWNDLGDDGQREIQQELIDNIVKKMSRSYNVELDQELCSDL